MPATEEDGVESVHHDEQHARSVICGACHAVVDLSQPLDVPGWRELHRCRTHVIEAETSVAGGVPWAWRALDLVSHRSASELG